MLTKRLAQYHSPFSGTVYVTETFGRREVVTCDRQGNRFTQSGSVVAKIWLPVLTRILKSMEQPAVLLFGLGGATLVDCIRSLRPKSAIDVVEIDPVMLDIAVTYFDFDPSEVNLYLDDARFFVSKPKEDSYDLVIIDLFCHEHVPEFTYEKEWVTHVRRILSDGGRIVFNRLLFGKHRQGTREVLDKLKELVYIESVNMVPSRFACSNMLIVCLKDARRTRDSLQGRS